MSDNENAWVYIDTVHVTSGQMHILDPYDHWKRDGAGVYVPYGSYAVEVRRKDDKVVEIRIMVEEG